MQWRAKGTSRRWCVKWMSQVLLFFTCWTHFKRTHWTENAQCHFYNTFIMYPLSLSLYVWKVRVASRLWESEESTREQRTIGMPKKEVKRKLCWAIADFAITNFFVSCCCSFIHTCTRKLLIPELFEEQLFDIIFVGCAQLMTLTAGKMDGFCIVFDVKSVSENNFFSIVNTQHNIPYHPIDIFHQYYRLWKMKHHIFLSLAFSIMFLRTDQSDQ